MIIGSREQQYAQFCVNDISPQEILHRGSRANQQETSEPNPVRLRRRLYTSSRGEQMGGEFRWTGANVSLRPTAQARRVVVPTFIGSALLAMSLCWSGSVSAAKFEPLNAAGLADACTSCHGVNGHSTGRIPSIGGLERTRLIRELKAFRAGEGEPTVMSRIARGYSDAEIEALGDYFSSVSTP